MYRIIFLFAVMLVLNSTKKIKKWIRYSLAIECPEVLFTWKSLIQTVWIGTWNEQSLKEIKRIHTELLNLTKPWPFRDFTLKSFSLDNWRLKVFPGLKRVSHEREMGSKIRDKCGFPNVWGLEMSLAYYVSWTFCELHLVAFKHLREQIIAPTLLSTK